MAGETVEMEVAEEGHSWRVVWVRMMDCYSQKALVEVLEPLYAYCLLGFQ
jgi:hypothetical protein